MPRPTERRKTQSVSNPHARHSPRLPARGPHPVGVREVRVRSSADPTRWLPTEVWYPAEGAADAELVSPHPFGRPHRAGAGLPPIRSACPLLVFSHGNSGLRQQSTFLTTHLASWGHVVAAPDHVGNTLLEMAALEDDEARRASHRLARARRPGDLADVLRALLDDGALGDDLPPLDPRRIGALGHSFGGWTALKLPRLEPRVRAICALAPASEAFVGRQAFAVDELPLPEAISTLIIAAQDDVLVDLETSVRPLHARLGVRARLEVIERADHFHFCDGVELLHGMHRATPRQNQLRPTRPWDDLIGEDEMHAWVCERVTAFFETALASSEPEAGRKEGGTR